MANPEMKSFWDQRYKDARYVYGVQPNNFFKEYIDTHQPGRLLLPAEGEGRNAVYASSRGWKVDAFDFSTEARSKAVKLARSEGVNIHYFTSNLEDVDLKDRQYDLIALIYVHMSPGIRRKVHRHLAEHLVAGGRVLIEAFNKDQLQHDSGGPKDPDKLYTLDLLHEDFKSLEVEMGEKMRVELHEGDHHSGMADILRLMARKS